ncbi:hypothetical protein JTB14_037267 [Gonioctena quinquepunctata]|nr:hypothetical protein JTB14_037267 [Gonioctena quinquepunctata]
MLKEQLRREIEGSGGLSPNQHGLRKGHSTTSAIEEAMKVAKNRSNRWCALVLFNIKNALNTATWSLIIRELIRRRVSKYLIEIAQEYLKERYIKVGAEEMEVNLTEGAKYIAYADDLALVVIAQRKEDLMWRVETLAVRIWLAAHRLDIAAEATGLKYLEYLGTTGWFSRLKKRKSCQ